MRKREESSPGSEQSVGPQGHSAKLSLLEGVENQPWGECARESIKDEQSLRPAQPNYRAGARISLQLPTVNQAKNLREMQREESLI
jgi:hypothetical protein